MKLFLFGLILIVIPLFVIFITFNHSLEALVEKEISNHMDTNINVAMNEYSHEFKEIEEFANILVQGNHLQNYYENNDTSRMQKLLSRRTISNNIDFAVVMDTNHTVFTSTSDVFSIESAATFELIDGALHGRSISSTEIITLNNPDVENMAQVYVTPIYINSTINSIFITGRVINNKTAIPQKIDSLLKDTTTSIFQEGYCISTKNSEMLGTQLPIEVELESSSNKISIGTMQVSSISYVYAARPITNYNGDVIGTLMIKTPGSIFTAPMSQFHQTIMIAGFAGLLFGLIFMVIRVKDITHPLLELIEATHAISQGNKYEKIKDPGSDELGELARSFNDMVDSFEEREFMVMQSTEEVLSANLELEEYRAVLQEKTALLEAQQDRMNSYNEILTILSSTIDLDTIITKGLDKLITYSKSPAGAVYLYDPQKEILSPTITQNTLKEVYEYEFALGEGIPGLSALKKEKMIVTDLDRDTIFRIEAGLCEFTPAAIVSIPLIFKDTLLGVIVTCHTDEIPDHTIQFMQQTVDQLAVSINNALSYRQIEQMAVELKNKHTKLEITSKELESVSKTKSEFLANMSHELRTPLNSIIGFSEILHDQTFGSLNEKQLKYVSNVLVSGKHLLLLINNILDISKVEAGKMELICEDFEVPIVIDEVKTLVSSIASKKKIQLKTVIEPGLITLHADTGKFKQILFNLLSNAIKFSPESGTVTVDVQCIEDMVQISVIDEGIGISDEDQKKLFKSFVQIDSSTSRQYEGTGLGLALAKQITELHGGKVWVNSEPGKGSTFIFTIPLTHGSDNK